MHAWRGSPSKNERFANNKTYILQPLIYGDGVSKLCVFHILVKNKCTVLHDMQRQKIHVYSEFQMSFQNCIDASSSSNCYIFTNQARNMHDWSER